MKSEKASNPSNKLFWEKYWQEALSRGDGVQKFHNLLNTERAHRVVLQIVSDFTTQYGRGPKVGSDIGGKTALEDHWARYRGTCIVILLAK